MPNLAASAGLCVRDDEGRAEVRVRLEPRPELQPDVRVRLERVGRSIDRHALPTAIALPHDVQRGAERSGLRERPALVRVPARRVHLHEELRWIAAHDARVGLLPRAIGLPSAATGHRLGVHAARTAVQLRRVQRRRLARVRWHLVAADVHALSSVSASAHAAIVASMSASVCVFEMNAASNCDAGQ